MEKHVPAERFNGVKTNGRPWPQEKKGGWCRRWRLHLCTPYRPFVDVSVNTSGLGQVFLPCLLRFTPPDPTHIRETLSIEVGGNILARRNTAASKKAAELAAGFAAREEELQNLAVEFFDLEEKSKYGKIQKRIQEYQPKLEELQQQSDETEAELRAQQAPIIFAMKQAGESPANIAKRLDISHAVVTRALRAEKEKNASAGIDDSTSPEEGDRSNTAEVGTSNYSNNEESISYGISEN